MNSDNTVRRPSARRIAMIKKLKEAFATHWTKLPESDPMMTDTEQVKNRPEIPSGYHQAMSVPITGMMNEAQVPFSDKSTFSGTTEGAQKGWETKHAGGAVADHPEGSHHDFKEKAAENIASSIDEKHGGSVHMRDGSMLIISKNTKADAEEKPWRVSPITKDGETQPHKTYSNLNDAVHAVAENYDQIEKIVNGASVIKKNFMSETDFVQEFFATLGSKDQWVYLFASDPIAGLTPMSEDWNRIVKKGWSEKIVEMETADVLEFAATEASTASSLTPGSEGWSEVVKKAWLTRKANKLYKTDGEDAAKQFLKDNAPHLLDKWKPPKGKESSEPKEPAIKEAADISTPKLTIPEEKLIMPPVPAAPPKDIKPPKESPKDQMSTAEEASKKFGGPVINGYTQIDGQKGSNPGGWYKNNSSGYELYIKDYNNKDRVETERMANAVYHALGVPVPASTILKQGDKSFIALKKVDGAKPMTAEEMAAHPDVQKGFMADVLLRNWDAVGMSHDNIMLGKDGHAYRIDQGGSLAFRAKGAPKPETGAHTVDEIKSMKDPSKNPAAAKVFANAQITKEQAGQLKTYLNDSSIHAIVTNTITNPVLQSKYIEQLKNRRDAIIASVDKETVPVKASKSAKAEKVPEDPNENFKIGDVDRRTAISGKKVFDAIEAHPEYQKMASDIKADAIKRLPPEFIDKVKVALTSQYGANNGYLSPKKVIEAIQKLPDEYHAPAMKLAANLVEGSRDLLSKFSGSDKFITLYRGVSMNADTKWNWKDKRDITSWTLSKQFAQGSRAYLIEAKVPLEKVHMFLPLVARALGMQPSYHSEVEALVLQDESLKPLSNIYHKGKLMTKEQRDKFGFSDTEEPVLPQSDDDEQYDGEITPLMFLIAAIARISDGVKLSPDDIGVDRPIGSPRKTLEPLKAPKMFNTLVKSIRPLLFDGTSDGAVKGWQTRRGGAGSQIESEKTPKDKADSPEQPKRKWIDKDPSLPIDTRAAYTGIDGRLTPERQKLHDQIQNEFLDKVKPVPPTQKPVAIVMMGGTASGKSSLVKGISKKDFVEVNPDAVKERLPEYQKATQASAKNAAAMVHEESSDLAKAIRDKAIEQNKNVVIDGTGRNAESYSRMIEKLQDKGYHVRVIMPDLDVDTAIERAKGRAERTGRWVPESFIRDSYNIIPKNFPRIAAAADEFALYNSRKKPPELVWDKTNGRETVHDKAFVDKFTGRHKFSEEDMKDDKPLSVDLDEVMKRAWDTHNKDVEAFQKLPKIYDADQGFDVSHADRLAD